LTFEIVYLSFKLHSVTAQNTVIVTQVAVRTSHSIYSKLSIIRLQLIRVSDNPDRNMKNEKCCSQLDTYFERHIAFRKADESLLCSDKT
jgi:hypothetical protein